MTTRKCTKCGEVKPLDGFHKDCRREGTFRRWCKSCVARAGRVTKLKKYGITIDQYEMMLERQHYGCKICGQQCATGRSLAVDHCHQTGRVRGLLCIKCNKALGLLDDDVNRMNLAAQYLTCSGEWLPGCSC